MQSSLRDIAVVFLKLGTLAFGGPAAHVSMMEDEVVRRRKWMSREQFLDYLGAANLIPGPNSTELAIHVGHAQAGWPGLVVAGTAFILPAALIVSGIAWAYVRYGSLPQMAGILYAVKPIVIAVVLQALVALGRTAIKSRLLAVLGIAAAAAAAAGLHELLVLALGGLAALVIRRRIDQSAQTAMGPPAAIIFAKASPSVIVAGSAATVVPFGLWPMFGAFLKIGAVLFGSGYVLLAFLRADFVERFGWLTEQQLVDAIAVGQFTPGPVFTTATFIGFVLGGGAGAAFATVGIFLPAFVFVAISGPLVPRLRRSPFAAAVLDGVNVASLALMAVVTAQLARAALVDVGTVAIAAVAALLLLRFRMNSAWLMLGGVLIGITMTWLRLR